MPPETDQEHYDRLHREYAAGLSERMHSAIYGFAYDKGHSAGHHEVEEEYKAAAEFALELLTIEADER